MAANKMPAAEVEVSADLVRRLLADQHPDLARLPVEFLANGWDNELYRVGDELVARLPRRALGAQIIKNEQRWLPGLAPRLPLPVPYPERTGVPGCGYPYSWSVVPYLPGVPAAQASSFDAGRAAAAVGGFLGALHVPAPADAPANPFRGVPLAERAGTFAANLALPLSVPVLAVAGIVACAISTSSNAVPLRPYGPYVAGNASTNTSCGNGLLS